MSFTMSSPFAHLSETGIEALGTEQLDPAEKMVDPHLDDILNENYAESSVYEVRHNIAFTRTACALISQSPAHPESRVPHTLQFTMPMRPDYTTIVLKANVRVLESF